MSLITAINVETASRFLGGLVRASAQGAVLVLLVLLAQWVFRRWLTPRWRCALWLLVMGRLLLPVSLPTRVSVFNLVPAAPREYAPPAGRGAVLVTGSAGAVAASIPDAPRAPTVSIIDETGERGSPAPVTATAAPSIGEAAIVSAPALLRQHRTVSWPLLLLGVWLIGAGALGLHVIVATVRAARRFRGLREASDPAVLAVLEECRVRMRVRTRLQVVEGPDLRSPALHGAFRPRLLLPINFTPAFSLAELHFIFLHELAHVKRRDVLLNWLVALLQVVHWFNPLVWFAFARWRMDRELACDALALEAAGAGRNVEYGRTILRLLEGFTHRVAAPGLVGILEDKRQLRQRIGMIASFVPARRWSLLAVLLLVGLGVVCLTDGQDKRPGLDRAKGKPISAPAQEPESSPPVPTQAKPSVTNGSVMKVIVLDAENGQPLANAEVFAPSHASFFGHTANRPRWMTDESGVAMIHLGEVPPDHLQQQSYFPISVRREGYAPRGLSWSADNKDVRPSMPAEISVRLSHGLTAGGLVRDELSAPVADVRVRIFGTGYLHGLRQEYPEFYSDPDASPAVVTDALGRWVVNDFPRDLDIVRIELIRPDGSSQRFVQEGESDPREIGEPVKLKDLRASQAVFVLKNGLGVRGRVLDPEGKPLPRVLVKAGYSFGNVKSAGEAHTDVTGRFEFHHLPLCQMILTAYPSNFAITSTIIDITTNTPEIRLPVTPLSPLHIHVLDGDGRAMAGAKVNVDKYRSEGQVLDFSGTTDHNGALTWTNAPISDCAIVAMASPQVRQKILITPQQRDVTFRLREGMEKEIVVNGRVNDARTEAAVKVESVSFQTGDHEGFRWPGEILDSGFRLTVPATRFRPGGSYPIFQLRLQAKGYAPLITPWRDFDQGDWSANFVMQPADGARRTVLLPDGQPAANARVWVRANQYDPPLFCNGPNRYLGDRLLQEQAGANGEFLLPSVPENQAVVVTHADGFLATTLAEFKQTRAMRLQPWGRVEGHVIADGKPKAELRVNLSTLLWLPAIGCHLIYNTVTGPDGRFTFTNVPPGEYKLYRCLGRSQSGPITESHHMPIVVEAGETLRVQYGGAGRAVIGQALSDKPDQPVDWQRDNHLLVLKRAPIPTVNSENFATYSAFRKAYDDSSARLQQAREARTYQLEFEPDGSFRVDDVPPGTYELRLRVTKPKQNQQQQFSFYSRPEDELGSLVREVVVPPGQEAFDLGRLVVAMKEDPTLQRVAPAELDAQTLDGKIMHLGQYKGKYVLMAFWASWSERCAEQLAELRKLQNELSREDRLTFLSLNLDEDAASARQASAPFGHGWNLARLEGRARANVTAAFKVDTLPAVFLLDTEGRVVARDLEGQRVRAVVERALKRNEP